jgi:L-seryl-tRNA(Ser) seleniumtransferase
VSRFAEIPKVDDLLNRAERLIAEHGRSAVKTEVRNAIDGIRNDMLQDQDAGVPGEDDILESVKAQLQQQYESTLIPVINLTGTVLHTNLGRARLPQVAIEAMQTIGQNYSNLEYDLDQGNRGDRDVHVESLIQRITGAEAATVVNNNAAAVMITLSALAAGKEVPVSRGELVEIGGSFRIPDIMSQSGCTLKEVGTTNRTHAKDYAGAVSENTALLMKVHTSNYEINGFTHAVSDAEVASIAHDHDLPFVTDLGSGTLIDLRRWQLPYETTVQDSLDAGADVVTFSGDKLLGGPQCGLIVGRRDLIDKIKSHPLKRAVRIDKMTMTALAAVLRLYLNPDRLASQIPALRDLSKRRPELFELAQSVTSQIQIDGFTCDAVELESQIGSGALPTHTIPSAGIAFRAVSGKGSALISLEQKFRGLPTPILGRISDDALLLDFRTLDSASELIDQISNQL